MACIVCLEAGFWSQRIGYSVTWLHEQSDAGVDFLLILVVPPLLYTHLSPPSEMCDNSDRQHSITSSVSKLGASPLVQHVAGEEDGKLFLLTARSRPFKAQQPHISPPQDWQLLMISSLTGRYVSHDHGNNNEFFRDKIGSKSLRSSGQNIGSVGIVTGYGLDSRGVGLRVPVGARCFFTLSRPVLRPTQPPIQLAPGLKRPGREADRSAPSSAQVKNGGVTPSLPHVSSWHSA
jgi:hypothetical protein